MSPHLVFVLRLTRLMNDAAIKAHFRGGRENFYNRFYLIDIDFSRSPDFSTIVKKEFIWMFDEGTR